MQFSPHSWHVIKSQNKLLLLNITQLLHKMITVRDLWTIFECQLFFSETIAKRGSIYVNIARAAVFFKRGAQFCKPLFKCISQSYRDSWATHHLPCFSCRVPILDDVFNWSVTYLILGACGAFSLSVCSRGYTCSNHSNARKYRHNTLQ